MKKAPAEAEASSPHHKDLSWQWAFKLAQATYSKHSGRRHFLQSTDAAINMLPSFLGRLLSFAMRPHFETVIQNLDLLGILSEYNPIVIGTPPLGIDIDGSDIDVACCANDLEAFGKFTESMFGNLEGFLVSYIDLRYSPVALISFKFSDWEIELFCQEVKTGDQWGVRHFRVEQRLLDLDPNIRHQIRRLKQLGNKTEPAFAMLLGLKGDPYQSVLDLETKTDDTLQKMLVRAADRSAHNSFKE